MRSGGTPEGVSFRVARARAATAMCTRLTHGTPKRHGALDGPIEFTHLSERSRSGTLAAQPQLMSSTLNMTPLPRVVTNSHGKDDVGSVGCNL